MSPKTVLIGAGTVITAMVLAGVALSLDRSDPPGLGPVGPEQAAKVFRKAPGTGEKARRSPRVDGQTWGLRSYTNVSGDLCLSHDVPGEAVGTGCMPAGKVFARGPLLAIRGARQKSRPYPTLEWDNQWIYGFAHPAVESLTLVNFNCSTRDLSMDEDGAFHHVVGRAALRDGELPYKLVARGVAGEVLAERVFAASIPRNARNAGIPRPRVGRACS